MLIIVHDRNTNILESIFNFKTPGCSYVLEIYPSKYRCNIPDLVGKIGLAVFKTERECIDTGKFLEEDGFAFHYRDSRICPDIAQSEHR